MEKEKLRKRDYRIGVVLPTATIEAMGGKNKELRDKNYSVVLSDILDYFTPPTIADGLSYSRKQISRTYKKPIQKIFFTVSLDLHKSKEQIIKGYNLVGIAAYVNDLVFRELIKRFGA